MRIHQMKNHPVHLGQRHLPQIGPDLLGFNIPSCHVHQHAAETAVRVIDGLGARQGIASVRFLQTVIQSQHGVARPGRRPVGDTDSVRRHRKAGLLPGQPQHCIPALRQLRLAVPQQLPQNFHRRRSVSVGLHRPNPRKYPIPFPQGILPCILHGLLLLFPRFTPGMQILLPDH